MESTPCYWFALHPDIKRPVGGVKQIHRVAEAIVKSGRKAILIQDDSNFHPSWFSSKVDTISRVCWSQLSGLNPLYNSVVLPETFITALPTYSRSLPKIIFNQNGSYTFGLGTGTSSHSPRSILDLYASNHLSHVMCVSRHDHHLLTSGLGLSDSKVSLIINGLETSLFKPSKYKKRQIAFMPRKNSRDCQIVLSLLASKPWLRGWSLVPIDGYTQQKVASILQDSLLFFSFGHPEGFGLPVAEALACGCAVVGYTGLGGKELFSLAKKFHVVKEISYGDWLGFVDATYEFIKAFEKKPKWLLSSLTASASSVRSIYNEDEMHKSVNSALDNYESHLR